MASVILRLTTKGTRPGDPVGDILFNMVMMLVLQDVTQYMKAHTSAVWEGEATPVKDLSQSQDIPVHAWCEIAFVDDLAVLLRAPTQNDMHCLAKQAFGAVHEAARTRGLHLNMEAGKTELLMAFVGAGSKDFKTCLAKDGFLIDVSEFAPDMQLRVVHSYKHLGSWVHADGQPRHTLRERVRSAKQSWGPLIRPFFKKSSISVRAKVIVFESLIYSRLLFNVHVSTRCTPDLIEKWEAGIRTALAPLVRAQLYGQPPFTFSTSTLCGLAEMLAPSDALHIARLRFAKRFLQHCPQALWDVIHSGEGDPSSWLSSLRSSLSWFCTFLGPRAPLQSEAAMADWWSFIAIDEAWYAKIKRAAAACRQFRKAEAQAHVWECHFETMLRQDGACACLDRQADSVRQWICDLCGGTFASKKALGAHAAKVHNYRNVFRHFAVDGQCPACARDFHHRSRLVCHWRTASSCFAKVRACFPPMPNEIVEVLVQEDAAHTADMKAKGWLSTKALFPVFHGQGPGLPDPGSEAAAIMLQKWTIRRPPDESPLFGELEGHHEGDSCAQVDDQTDPFYTKLIPFVLESAEGDLTGDADRFAMTGLARLHAALHIRTLCFVHFFSGYRRVGDLQHQIEAHWIQETTQLFCVSVDFCIQKEGGDLTLDSSREFWLSQIFAGAICGVGGGPPCETFTAARMMPGGPVPLRSFDHMNGLPHNTKRGWDQTHIGSILLRFILTMVVAAARVGASAFVEHPAFPTWIMSKRPSSIWASRPVRLLKRLNCTQITTVDQCLLGCAAKKPTTLLVIRMPTLVAFLQSLGERGRCNHPHGSHKVLRGINEKGEFNTALAKVYPPLLNRALADAIAQAARVYSDHRQRVDPLPEPLAPFLSFDFVAPSIVQPDCYM